MQVHAEEQGLRIKQISPEAMDVFHQYDWPGNIRELRNLIERLMIMAPGPVIEASQAGLSLQVRPVRPAAQAASPAANPLFTSRTIRSVMPAMRLKKNLLRESCVNIIGTFPARRKT